jgi:3-oxoadipate enol-lactonase
MTNRATSMIRAQLVPGEELLWAGTPRTGLFARPISAWLALGSVAFIIFVLYGVVWLGERRVSEPDPLFAVELLGLVSILAGFGYDYIRRNNAYFGLTDRRALSLYWLFGMRIESAAFGHVDTVTVTKRRDKSGTVTFGTPLTPETGNEFGKALDDWPMTGPVVFDMIEDVDRVASLVDTVLEVRREVDWDAAVSEMTFTFAKSGDINIAFAEAGTGEPILFLHGVGATKKCWAMQMRLLSRKFRCIALDYRGYGESDIPPVDSISREAYAGDVAAVMDAAGIDKAVLCGNSLGGVVALEFYKQFPQRVRSLVLVDSFAFYPGGAESIPDRIKTLDDLGIEKFAETRSPALFAPDAPKWLVERARADLASIPLEVYKASTRVTWSGDYRDLLPKINVGAMVVWGQYDTKIAPRALSKELALGIPACSDLATVPRAGHIPQMEAPLVFNLLLADYLK